MTDVIKEEVEQVTEVLTKSMAGQFIKDFIKSKNPRFAGKSKKKRKEMALGAFYSKEETESVDEGMFSPPKMITGKAAKNRKDYLRNYHPRLIAAKKAAGSSKDYDYEPQRDSETGGTKPSTHKNVYNSNKFKPATKMSFEAGLKRAAERAKSKTNEEVSLDEGRGRPPKPGSAAWKKRQSEGGGDSDTPGLHGQLIKHKHLQNAPPKIKFTNGEEAHVSAEHRDRAIKHLEGMIGPGKNPEARDNAVKAMSHSHAGFKQAIGIESKPEEKKSSMSAQRDKPNLSLTKEESKMAQEDIVEKLQAALDAGILSQNDFDKLTQIDELSSKLLSRASSNAYDKIAAARTSTQFKKVPDLRRQGQKFKDAANAKTQSEEVEQLAEGPSHLGYSGHVDGKEYTMTIPNKGDGLGNYSDASLHKLLKKQNPHLEHHEVSAIVNSGGEEESAETVVHKGKTHTHQVVNYQEPRHLYSEEVEAVDEKALSPKQKKIAAVAGDPGKLDAQDFKMIRKEETTAGVAAVVAALSRNLKELK